MVILPLKKGLGSLTSESVLFSRYSYATLTQFAYDLEFKGQESKAGQALHQVTLLGEEFLVQLPWGHPRSCHQPLISAL